MAEPQNVGIKQSWSLVAFAAGKKMEVGQFKNSETGDTFKSCIFTDKLTGDRQFAAFSSKMGELTPSEISSQKDKLQVVQLETGTYILCRQGESNWEEVIL